MNLEQEFCQAVKSHLDGLVARFDHEIEGVVGRRFPHGTAFLLFEYDSQHFADDFCVGVWPMDAAGEPIGDGHWFLRGDFVVVPRTIYGDEKYEEVEPWETASRLLEDWIVDRWQHVPSARLPAFIGHHDSYFKRELATGDETDWDKIIATVGQSNEP